MRPSFEIYYITDRHALAPQPLLPFIVEAIQAGVDVVQIREKDLATRELLGLVESAVKAAQGTAVRVVVNDRLDVALAAGAAGVHLGRRSLPAAVVRRHVDRSFLVGASCHSLEEATEAEAGGADYAVLGPIFETASKLAYGPPLGLEKLREVAARVKIPLLALGGITLERVAACRQAGAAGVAGISIFQNCPSVDARVRELRAQCAR